MKLLNPGHNITDPMQVGGKGSNLMKLYQIGIRVPDFRVIAAQEVSLPFSAAMLTEVSGFLSDDKLYAVRSSASIEDGQQHSFAGQFDSYLYLEKDEVLEAIEKVYKSVGSAHVKTYLENNGIKDTIKMAVIIQEMLDPEVSGVAFGLNPNTGNTDEKIITAVYGVGEGVVSGTLNADTFVVKGARIQKDIVTKEQQGRKGSKGTVMYASVDPDKRQQSTLTDDQIHEVARYLTQLEDALGGPQDIEFAYLNDTLYLLQTRPVTTKIKSKENRIVWDNSNIVESYPGVTTPLTFSYIREAYQKVYEQLALIMGASKKTIADNEAVFANMLGLIQGRVYYNLYSWYKVLSLFPGYELNARFMETMMGVKEKFELEKTTSSNKIKAAWRTSVMISKIFWNLMTIKKQTKAFIDDVDCALEELNELDFDSMTAYELKQTWINLDVALTPKWKAPLINDSFAMIYFGKLKKLTEKYQVSENPNIHNDLLCGSKDIISVEPIHRSIAISTAILEDEDLTRLFKENSPEEIWSAIKKYPIYQDIQAYLKDFGERCVGELKLETISFQQDPTQFMSTIKSFVLQGVTKTSTENKNVDVKLRNEAENEVKKVLKSKFFKQRKMKKAMAKARYFVSNRENLRYERTRVFGATRAIFTAIGREFESQKQLEHYRDIFYLTKEEVFDFIDGTAVMTDLKLLVESRKKQYENYRNMEPPPERFTTYGAVNLNTTFEPSLEEESGDADLSGLGCCPGIVNAKVQVIHHPSEIESLNGDILVTSSTDPGWVTLFPTCSGIIVERGSLLSHSAIVSREMGIPCIVGVTGLLKRIKTGDEIRMDGSAGTIIFKHND